MKISLPPTPSYQNSPVTTLHRYLQCTKGFFSCFALIQRVEQHLSFRKGKGGTSGLGGSHRWRGTHRKIESRKSQFSNSNTQGWKTHTLEESNGEFSQAHYGFLSKIRLWYIVAGQSPAVLLTRGAPLLLSSCPALNPLCVEEHKAWLRLISAQLKH